MDYSALYPFELDQADGDWLTDRFACSVPVHGRVAIDVSSFLQWSIVLDFDEAGGTEESGWNVGALALCTLRRQETAVLFQFSAKRFAGNPRGVVIL